MSVGPVAQTAEVVEAAPGIFRLVLPLGIHGVPSLSAYLLATAPATPWWTAGSRRPGRRGRDRAARS